MATIAEKLKGLGGAVISAVTDTAVDSYRLYRTGTNFIKSKYFSGRDSS